MTAPDWWRRWPFLPVPDAKYVRYRMETAYGSARPPEPDDVITYLEWCRESERARKTGARRAAESPVHFDHRR
jgi:hypothetical protein